MKNVKNSGNCKSIKTRERKVIKTTGDKLKAKPKAKVERKCDENLPGPSVKNVCQKSNRILYSANTTTLRKAALFNYLNTFSVDSTTDLFDSRVTALTWHYSSPYLWAVATKAGSVSVMKTRTSTELLLHKKGIGPGGSCPVIKFNPLDPECLYMVTLEGIFKKLNYQTGAEKVLLRTEDCMKSWYVSFDLNVQKNMMVCGDTTGYVNFLSKDGIPTRSHKLHKSHKIAHLEFSKRDPNILCTASNDKVVRIWDVRHIREKTDQLSAEPLYSLLHEKPLNAATFSRTDGTRLLTTDQGDCINVYRAPSFHLERSIKHPHRFFQYITPIRASWHPFEDIIMIGRYPSPGSEDIRSLDLIDADSGDVMHELLEHSKNVSIKSINEFNLAGDILASSTGQSVLLWRSS